MKIQILENTKNISKKNEYIKKYNLKHIGKCKEYFILNTSIISYNTYLEFYKIINNDRAIIGLFFDKPDKSLKSS